MSDLEPELKIMSALAPAKNIGSGSTPLVLNPQIAHFSCLIFTASFAK
jgi:hypothetical protein